MGCPVVGSSKECQKYNIVENPIFIILLILYTYNNHHDAGTPIQREAKVHGTWT